MKSFDDWFDEKYGEMDFVEANYLRVKLLESWQAAQEVQRDNLEYMIDNGLPIYDVIRNNKV